MDPRIANFGDFHKRHKHAQMPTTAVVVAGYTRVPDRAARGRNSYSSLNVRPGPTRQFPKEIGLRYASRMGP
jgi:hypothetical protein